MDGEGCFGFAGILWFVTGDLLWFWSAWGVSLKCWLDARLWVYGFRLFWVLCGVLVCGGT